MKTTILRSALCVAAFAVLSLPATAGDFTTLDGGSISLRPIVVPSARAGGNGFQSVLLMDASVAWTVMEPSGVEYQGVFARTGGVRDDLPLLIQNPSDGEVHLIFSSPNEGTKDLFLRTWLGQSWSEPVWLAGTPDGDDHLPRAAFTAGGEIVLVWIQERESGSRNVLFQYGVMDASGMLVRHAHVDMGHVEIYTLPIEGDVRLADGVAHVTTDLDGEAAVIVLASPDRDKVGLLGLDLRALRQTGGGGNFPPVPVTFLLVPMSNGRKTLSDRIAAALELLPTWRVEMLGGEAYYWFGQETMTGLAFRDGQARDLVSLDRPENELQAHAMMVGRLRVSLGRFQAEIESIQVRQESLRSRRVH